MQHDWGDVGGLPTRARWHDSNLAVAPNPMDRQAGRQDGHLPGPVWLVGVIKQLPWIGLTSLKLWTPTPPRKP